MLWGTEQKNYKGYLVVPGEYKIESGWTNNQLINHLRSGNGRLDAKMSFTNVKTLKDLSFENPNPLDAYKKDGEKPNIQVNVNTAVKKLPDNAFEVTLDIKTEAKNKDKIAFIAEVSYAGIFTLNKVPTEHEKPLLLIEAYQAFLGLQANVL